MPDKIEDIAAEAGDALDAFVRRAFEAGRKQGRREAAGVFRARVLSVMDNENFDSQEVDEDEAEPSNVEELAAALPGLQEAARAAPNSVKPTIMKLILNQPGLTTHQVRTITGFKHNSIRGTLWTLGAQEQAIERRDGRWYPVAQKDEAAGEMSRPDAPTASVTGDIVTDDDAIDQL